MSTQLSEPSRTTVTGRGGKYLTFALGREEYGLQILKVREIIGFMEITAVPRTPAYVRGVTLHAEVMQRRPRAFLGYHQWQIYYLTRHGSVLLPEGYAERRPVPVREWLRRARGGSRD